MMENTPGGGDGRGALALLGIHEPGRARDARVRARCHAALGKRRRRKAVRVGHAWRATFEPALVGSLCAAYLIEVLSRAARLYRF